MDVLADVVFCTISAHQGKFISSRTQASILKEVDAITNMPDFNGYITDIGGPSANMYKNERHKNPISAKSCKKILVYISFYMFKSKYKSC